MHAPEPSIWVLFSILTSSAEGFFEFFFVSDSILSCSLVNIVRHAHRVGELRYLDTFTFVVTSGWACAQLHPPFVVALPHHGKYRIRTNYRPY